jgi:hypothetical protein
MRACSNSRCNYCRSYGDNGDRRRSQNSVQPAAQQIGAWRLAERTNSKRQAPPQAQPGRTGRTFLAPWAHWRNELGREAPGQGGSPPLPRWCGNADHVAPRLLGVAGHGSTPHAAVRSGSKPEQFLSWDCSGRACACSKPAGARSPIGEEVLVREECLLEVVQTIPIGPQRHLSKGSFIRTEGPGASWVGRSRDSRTLPCDFQR